MDHDFERRLREVEERTSDGSLEKKIRELAEKQFFNYAGRGAVRLFLYVAWTALTLAVGAAASRALGWFK